MEGLSLWVPSLSDTRSIGRGGGGLKRGSQIGAKCEVGGEMTSAVADADWGLAAKYGSFVAVVGAANLAMDVLIRWRRHHG